MSSYFKRIAVLFFLIAAAISSAQIDVFSNGSSGDFIPTQNTVVDLGLAPSGIWNQANVGANGVYDPSKWVVVFHYTNVTIPSGVTVTFINHPKNPPVVWLVSGNVNIQGKVILSGAEGNSQAYFPPGGPGGFRGGNGQISTDPGGQASGGFGPGGAPQAPGFGGSYATQVNTSSPTYGNIKILPLIGGSGGSGLPSAHNNGGGGGGAILIACNNTVTLDGWVRTVGGGGYGGAGGGAGGAIRIICDTFNSGVNAAIHAYRGDNSAGDGRIRIEANTNNTFCFPVPVPSLAKPDGPVVLFPNLGAPVLQVQSVGGIAVPTDPSAKFESPDLALPTTSPVDVVIHATNVPLNWTVQVRQIAKSGNAYWYNCTFVSGDATSSLWHATLTFPTGYYAVISRAFLP